jgi:hypothetical protein
MNAASPTAIPIPRIPHHMQAIEMGMYMKWVYGTGLCTTSRKKSVAAIETAIKRLRIAVFAGVPMA